MSVALLLSTFCGVTALTMLVGSSGFDRLLRDYWRTRQRLAEQFPALNGDGAKTSPLFPNLKLLYTRTAETEGTWWSRFERLVEQSGLPTSPQRLCLMMAGAGGAVMSIAAIVLPQPWWGIPAGLAAAVAPLAYVQIQRQRRIDLLCQQLPEAFDQMKRAVKAGQTIPGAMQTIATDLRPPIAEEFEICCQQQGLGLPFPTAMEALARRTGVMELRIFVVALLVQREAGGNCLELLTNLAGVVRKRQHLAARVKALTGEGRMQAVVLGLMPIVAFAAIMLLKPDYGAVLLEYPYLLAALACSEILGAIWIRKIVSIDY